MLVQETLDAQSADIDMVSGATVTSEGYLQSLQSRARPGRAVSAAVRRRPRRYVEHVMGMPISLALRGRHAADDVGRAAGPRSWRRCARSTGCSAPTGDDSAVSRLGRGEVTWPTARPRSPRCSPWGEQAARGLRRRVRRATAPAPTARLVLDPSGVVKGWAAERAAEPLRALPGTDFCLSAGGDLVCRTARPRRAALADRHRGPARSRAGWSPSCRSSPARWPPPGTAHRGAAPRRRPHRAAARRASPRSPSWRPR